MARRVQKPYRKKKGEHGPLYQYEIEYTSIFPIPTTGGAARSGDTRQKTLWTSSTTTRTMDGSMLAGQSAFAYGARRDE